MATPGLDTYGARSGSPPYGESRWKAILRQAALGLGPGLQGLSAVPRGANFGEAFLSSLGASSKAYSAAQQAAQEYAMKQQQMEEDRQNREIQQAYTQALTKQLEKPQKKEIWQMTPEEQAASIEYDRRHAAALESVKPKKEGAAAKQERLVQIMGPNGKPMWVPVSQAIGKEPPRRAGAVTPAERQVLAYFQRMDDAEKTITVPERSGTSLEQRIAAQSVGGQLMGQRAPNLLQTEDQQRYRQAQRAFTEARLRKESGASIPNSEYENDAKTYFFQPGDKPETIKQKKKKRETVLRGLKNAAGQAYNEFYYGTQDQPEVRDDMADPLDAFYGQ